MNDLVGFDAFREQWLEDVRADHPSTTELGRRFAHKLFTQWRDLGYVSDDLVYCDGSGDGGVDLAYLERGETDSENVSGDTWYLVQSKYGQSFQGTNTLLQEGQKVIDTIEVGRERLSEVTGSVLERIRQFLRKADVNGGDRLLLIFATELPLNENQRRSLDNVRAVGRERLGNIFDVESISIETIYLNQLEDPTSTISPPICVPIEATMANSGKDLMVGSISLLKLYDFLKAYREKTENLDQLYEKNVRRFLGGRGKVNKGMQATLNNEPAQFGLYNNGITIVVKHFEPGNGLNTYLLTDPYIVNGCQTTRTLWEIFRQKFESGGKGTDQKLEDWTNKAKDGVVVAKIVKVGNLGEGLLQNITRYTNSQNAVRDKDFVTLDEGFHRWKREMAERYGIFLEVQRGGWDSQKALQKQNPQTHQFTESANAFDLLKVYGSGWLREAGTAFGRNSSFVPGGALYRQIVDGIKEPFGVDDLYAAYQVQRAADGYEFGRGSRKSSRRQTRYLFYMIVMDLLRDVLLRANKPSSHSDLTQALLRLATDKEAAQELFDASVSVVDEYLTQGEEDSVFKEPAFKERNSDLNGFLKWEQLGKGDSTPNFISLMAINKRTMGRGNPSPRDKITAAIG